MKILLVGANGQVGRAIRDLCKDKSVECIALSHEQLDITDAKAIEATLTQYVSANSYLVNAAAYTAVDKAEDEIEQCYKINCDAVANLAYFAKKHAIPLIHISTDYVFLGDSEHPYSETEISAPAGVYGASKLAGEQELQNIWEQHIILRVSWVFGQYGKNFVKTILRLAGEQETLRIVADQYGNPTGAAHIAEVILQIIQCLQSVQWRAEVTSKSDEKAECMSVIPEHFEENFAKSSAANGRSVWGIYHYCDAPSTTWFNFAQSIVETAQLIKPFKVKKIEAITTIEFPTKAIRPMNSKLNCDKIAEVFGIKQFLWQTELEQVIKKVLE